jgi:hypothetical protein
MDFNKARDEIFAKEAADDFARSKKRGRYDGRFPGIVAYAYCTAMVAASMHRERDEAIPTRSVTEAFVMFSSIYENQFTPAIRGAIEVRAHTAIYGASSTARFDGLAAPLGTEGIFEDDTARLVFDRTARSMYASVYERPRTLLPNEFLPMVVSGIEMDEGVNECREEQEYNVKLTGGNYECGFGDLTLRVQGDEGIVRYRFGTVVNVMVAPSEADPGMTTIAKYVKAVDALPERGEAVLRSKVERAFGGLELAVIETALDLADEFGSDAR